VRPKNLGHLYPRFGCPRIASQISHALPRLDEGRLCFWTIRPALWLSSLLVCSECGSNYVQYGRTDYVCSGFHNGSTCTNGMRFRIADIEKAVLEKLEIDCLSPEALNRAADLA
jgi:Recombinase zinc beta ribbon domain